MQFIGGQAEEEGNAQGVLGATVGWLMELMGSGFRARKVMVGCIRWFAVKTCGVRVATIMSSV